MALPTKDCMYRNTDQYRPITKEDILYISSKQFEMRHLDKVEAVAMLNTDPTTALLTTIMHSQHAWAMHPPEEESPVGFFGLLSGGVIWMVASDRIKSYRKKFVKLSREVIDAFRETQSVLWNFVGEHNRESIRWLSHLGFQFEDRAIIGGVPFRKFIWRNPCALHQH